jgi:hypothetical protein
MSNGLDKHVDGVYVIRHHPLAQYSEYYRVVNTKTGDESNYYYWRQCLAIIEHAKKGELLGSFDLGYPNE